MVHTERPHHIIIFISLIYDLALIYIICDMLENFCREFHSNTDIHPVFLLFDPEFITDIRDPFGSGTSRSQNQIFAVEHVTLVRHYIERSIVFSRYAADGGVKLGFHLSLAVIEDPPQDLYISIRPQMAHLGFQQVQVVAQRVVFSSELAVEYSFASAPPMLQST